MIDYKEMIEKLQESGKLHGSTSLMVRGFKETLLASEKLTQKNKYDLKDSYDAFIGGEYPTV